MTNPLSNGPSEVAAISRTEWWLVALIVVAGLWVRCSWLSRVSVVHFDEGVYSSNLWFGPSEGGTYPAQHLYAPPLLPTAIELSAVVFGPDNFSAILPALITGCFMPILVWWVGRTWFGPAAGIVAGILSACSEPHAYFSRTALTDVPLSFFLTLAVFGLSQYLIRGGVAWCVLATMGASAAWWTKYNGWLPIAIGFSGLAGWWVAQVAGKRVDHFLDFVGGQLGSRGVSHETASHFSPTQPSLTDVSRETVPVDASTHQLISRETGDDGQVRSAVPGASTVREQQPDVVVPPQTAAKRQQSIPKSQTIPSSARDGVPRETESSSGRILGRLVLFVALTMLAWAPVVWGLQDKGGYASVAANHERFFVGLAAWFHSAMRQLETTMQLESGLSGVSILLAIGASCRLTCSPTGRKSNNRWNLVVGLCGMLSGTNLLTGILAIVWGVSLIADTSQRKRLSAWLLCAWLIGLTIAIPLYAPYPRLAVPWMVATWLACGALLAPDALCVIPEANSNSPKRDSLFFHRRRLIGFWGIVIGTVGWWVTHQYPPTILRQTVLKQSHHSVERAADEIIRQIAVELPPPLGQSQEPQQSPNDSSNRMGVRDPIPVGGDTFVVYIQGEPALFYQLKRRGLSYVKPVQGLGFVTEAQRSPLPCFLVLGARSRDDASLQEDLDQAGKRIEFLKTIEIEVPPLVWLDEPWQPIEFDRHSRQYSFHLYRIGAK